MSDLQSIGFNSYADVCRYYGVPNDFEDWYDFEPPEEFEEDFEDELTAQE